MVRQPESDLGTAAAKAVLDRLHAPDQGVYDKVVLPTQLIVRESTAAPNRGNQTQK
jgi:DNA-binding LacI/PurR family transcriptional regulator